MAQEGKYKVGKNILLILFVYGFPVFAMMLVFQSLLEGQLLRSIGIYLSASIIMGSSLAVLIHHKKLKKEKWQPGIPSKTNRKWTQPTRVIEESTLF